MEEQVLVYTIWAGNARILNIPESTELCPNVGQIFLDKCNQEFNFQNMAEYA